MTAAVKLRKFETKDLQSILRINEESVHFLAPMDEARLHMLQSWSACIRVAEYEGKAAGFLVTFEDGSDYDSVNYHWFSTHLKKFVYIDRIVIDQAYRGKGIGQQFYTHLKDTQNHTQPQSCFWLAAEIDIEPRNDRSLAFHKQQGFVEVATQRAGLGKQVSLQVLSL